MNYGKVCATEVGTPKTERSDTQVWIRQYFQKKGNSTSTPGLKQTSDHLDKQQETSLRK